ncbi:MAG TPA: hypothetical protein VFK90_14885 [Anaeromyxobacter sp.]|nr:hypothetical protein [Anaeromyxobacter sp.]
MWERIQWVFREAMNRLGAVLAEDLPGIVAMAVVVLVAVLLAYAVRAVLRFALARIGFDRRAREWGMTAGGVPVPGREPSALFAQGGFWFVIAAGVSVALAVLGASTTSALGLQLLALLPRLVVGALVMLVGIGVARFLERGVLIGAVNQGIRQARLVAWGVKWVVIALAAAMALEHTGIGGSLPVIAFSILVGGAVLAGALAVGLGARDAVSRALERRDEERPSGKGERAAGDRIHHL